jgi:hypothetical protein
MIIRLQNWRYYLPRERVPRLKYWRFQNHPFYEYMPLYCLTTKYLYLINKHFWEYPKWPKRRRIKLIYVADIKEIRFVNNTFSRVKSRFGAYNDNYLNESYLLFLKRRFYIKNDLWIPKGRIKTYESSSFLAHKCVDFYIPTYTEKLGSFVIKIGILNFR